MVLTYILLETSFFGSYYDKGESKNIKRNIGFY